MKTQWIVPIALQLVPGVLLLMGIFWCPETPRWYAKQDNWEGAIKSLTWTRKLPADHDFIVAELQEIRQQATEYKPFRGNPKMVKKTAKRLFEKGTRNRIGIGLLLMACQNLTGVNVCRFPLVVFSHSPLMLD